MTPFDRDMYIGTILNRMKSMGARTQDQEGLNWWQK